jgi:hypothetical protein
MAFSKIDVYGNSLDVGRVQFGDWDMLRMSLNITNTTLSLGFTDYIQHFDWPIQSYYLHDGYNQILRNHSYNWTWNASVSTVHMDSTGEQIAYLQDWNPELTNIGGLVAQWNVTVIGSPEISITFTISGLPDFGYKIYQNGSLIGTGYGPIISFVASGNSSFQVTVWHEESVSRLLDIGFIMLELGILVSIMAATIQPLRDKKRFSPEKIQRTLIRMVVFTIIALVLLGVVHNVIYG